MELEGAGRSLQLLHDANVYSPSAVRVREREREREKGEGTLNAQALCARTLFPDRRVSREASRQHQIGSKA